MAVDDPIRIGAAAAATLIAESGSRIATDDFGVQHGSVRHWLGDQSLAQSSRFALGASYSGNLPQYSGFLVEKSGDITGLDGKCANLDVLYAKIDSLWSNVPKRTHDLQLVNITPGDISGYGPLATTLYQVIVPIPHPVISYKYASASFPTSLGTYGTPSNAPAVPDFLFKIQTYDLSNPNIDIEQKIVENTATLLTILPDGTCTRSTFTSSGTFTGTFIQNTLGTINMLNVNFTADPNGWFCLKEDVTQIASSIYIIESQWKRNYIFNGTSPGTWWNGGHQIHC